MEFLKGCLLGFISIIGLTFILTIYGIGSCTEFLFDSSINYETNVSNRINNIIRQDTLVGMECICVDRLDDDDSFFIDKKAFYEYLENNMTQISKQHEEQFYGRMVLGKIPFPRFDFIQVYDSTLKRNRASYIESSISGDLGELNTTDKIGFDKSGMYVFVEGQPYSKLIIQEIQGSYFKIRTELIFDPFNEKEWIKIWKCQKVE